ncbi:prevent-host-death family protein [Candidatus Electrothrix aarhusensis]|uniref:Antitoxin n=1 Tax=Candidatus Electrothrix aarhusensis TaxID=1859131 RepID=A0A444J309_9BACT|nr:prevent-host-death family protein [Candidatus Electrothrix aarhusensis]
MIRRTTWALQDAKNKFSQVVNEALTHGPQYVMRRGVNTVVVLSVRDYEKLTSQKPSFTDFLLSAPKIDNDADPFERQHEYPRELDL